MAYYSFVCEDCTTEYEVSCSFAQSGEAACPKCGSQAKSRLFQPPHVTVKAEPCRHQAACPASGQGCCGGSCH